MKQYLMALDQGTTSSRCVIFDTCGNVVAKHGIEFAQHYPAPAWVEHDPEDIWQTQLSAAREALSMAGLCATDIAAIGITNQRETTIVWEKKSGKPIYPAIVWQCRRTEEICEQLKREGDDVRITQKTGLTPDPYFSATKLKWILDHVEGARERARNGELLFGTVDTWLIYRLTGGRVHATDVSNAARTMLFNIHTLSWDRELLALFDIPAAMLPEVRPSAFHFGDTDKTLFGGTIPIMGVAGDQQAALFGQGCFSVGSAKNTYGTGGFLLMNTGNTPARSENGLLTTVGWQIGDEIAYVLEGSVFICGAAIQWLRDGLSLITSAPETEAIAMTVKDSGGVCFVPAFVGLGTPYWDSAVRGTICGITRGTTRAHLVRATLDAMAFQTAEVLLAMQRDTGLSLDILKVDGGAAANNLLLQLQSDYSGVRVVRPTSVESTALGAAGIAGVAAGIWASKEAFAGILHPDREFRPTLDPRERASRLALWQKAVGAARYFAN